MSCSPHPNLDGDAAALAEIAEQLGVLEYNSFRHATLAVVVDDYEDSTFLQKTEESTLRMVQMSAGMHFNTGVELSGGRVWKTIDK
eukprot:6335366-Pyramimonas_sp.AAC.1